MQIQGTRKGIFLGVVCLAAYLVYLLHEPARGAHSWDTWMFGRIFQETGGFMAMGRSPLYAVYTSLFLPLGYPLGPFLARFINGIVIFAAIYFLIKPYLGWGLAVFGAVVWVPAIMAHESIVLGLAVACFCAAFALRHGKPKRSHLVFSYAFLILAVMFRPNYIVLLPAMAAYDVITNILKSGFRPSLRALVPQKTDWPVALLIGLWIVFAVNQSDHRWNNGYTNDNQWMGTHGGRSTAIAAQIGAFAHWIIVNKYNEDFDNHDIHLVVENDLKDLHSLTDIFKYPEVLKGHLIRNIQIVNVVAIITDLGDMLVAAATRIGSHKFAYPVFYALLGWGLFAMYRRQQTPEDRWHFLQLVGAAAVVLGPLIMVWPVTRYYFFSAPFFILGGAGIGMALASRVPALKDRGQVRALVIALPVLLFSAGTSEAVKVVSWVKEEPAWQRPRLVNEVMDGRSEEIIDMLSGCKGIMMTRNYRFLAAFSPIPIDRLYSVYEIPPFGHYGEGEYDGLRPDRIDCVYIARHDVKPGLRSMTTRYSRNRDYLAPYVRYLESLGAETRVVDFGQPEGVIEITRLKN